MSESENGTSGDGSDSSGMALVIYILYLVGLVVGVTFLIGVVLAYVNRGDAPDWLESHYTFQIRTFWIGLLFSVISSALVVALVGYLLLLATIIWLIIRCAKGINLLNQRKMVFNAETWLIP